MIKNILIILEKEIEHIKQIKHWLKSLEATLECKKSIDKIEDDLNLIFIHSSYQHDHIETSLGP